MNTITNLFPSTGFNLDFFIERKSEAMKKGKKTGLSSDYGYMQIKNLLVPLKFLGRVKDDLQHFRFEHDSVLGAGDLFSAEFLRSLDSYEREVLMPCALILIERGEVQANFVEVKSEAA